MPRKTARKTAAKPLGKKALKKTRGGGAKFLPEANDEVLVAFQHGDARKPVILGSLWNSSTPPPTSK